MIHRFALSGPMRSLLILAVVVMSAYPIRTQTARAADPATQPGADAQTFGGFAVLGATPTGKTLFMKLPAGETLEAAIVQTADELGKALDAKPAISGAFANAQGKNNGGASLTGKLKGHDIKGVIFCGTGPNGDSATVVIDNADASKDDVAALFAFMPAQLKMTTHKFPDGSGSIDLPDGWTTPTQSASNAVVAAGPAGQLVAFGLIREIYDPNCRTVRMDRQTYQIQLQNYNFQMAQYQQSIRMHAQFPNTLAPGAPPKPPVAPDPDPNMAAIKQNSPLRYCKFCDGPDEVLKVWYPLGEDLGKRTGTPYTSLDKTILVIPADPDPAHPGVKSGTVYIAVTDHDGDKATHVRALNQISTSQIQAGEAWQLDMCVMRAPDAIFDRDLPVMKAVMNSVNLDMHVVNGEIAAQGAAVRKMGADMFAQTEKQAQEFQDQQARQFQDHERQIAAQEKATHDSSSDFIEYIGGVRDVYDTATGQMHSVDLFNSNGIVDGMNAAANDPNRFVQIPLRYER